MNIVTNLKEWIVIRKKIHNKTIGFVPTMGNLHPGHLSLYQQSKRENEVTVASIFINPTQFNQKKDFEQYSRTLDTDSELLEKEKVDYLLIPSATEMYPDHYHVQIHETELSSFLEGEYRPGHFTGMLTVVIKLLNLVHADHAYFGEKDYQQLLLIKKMVSALFLPVKIIACATIRSRDGLAFSSRNSRLNLEQRKKAVVFAKILKEGSTKQQVIDQLEALNFKIDYVDEKWNRRLAAIWLDDIRLIDNISLLNEN